MEIATFVIAVLGFVIATCSLVWNIVSWRLTSGRATVELRVGIVVTGGKTMHFPAADDWRKVIENALSMNDWAKGLTEEAFFVVVRNKGRLPVSVQNCLFTTESGASTGSIGGDDYGHKFPIRIDAGGPEVLLAYKANPVDALFTSVRQSQGSTGLTISARVELSNGKVVDSKQSLRI